MPTDESYSATYGRQLRTMPKKPVLLLLEEHAIYIQPIKLSAQYRQRAQKDYVSLRRRFTRISEKRIIWSSSCNVTWLGLCALMYFRAGVRI